MKLCIAEKPSVAKEIAGVLGATIRRDGYFEGSGYYVTWGFGHFCEMEEPDFYNDKWKKWTLEYLPMLPKKFDIRLKNDKHIRKQFNTVKKLLRDSEEVINCGDAGIEGELIQRWLLRKLYYQKSHKRLWISSLTREAIRRGFKNIRDSKEFDALYHAGFIRAIGDWLLGMNATRVYTLKSGNLLTVGRVQTPTLALVVERHKEIQNFKPETYWRVATEYKNAKFLHKQKRFKKKEEAERILSAIQNQPLVITDIEEKEQKILPPKLFDLTTLQVECNRYFGFSAALTLQLAQKLYEKKLITYPRVDTQYLSNDIHAKVPNILRSISASKAYAEFTRMIPPKPKKKARYFNDSRITDHHAIIPTDEKPALLPADELKVLDLITRRFLAIFFPDAVELNTRVTAAINKHVFLATGKVLKNPGWKILYKNVRKKKEKEENFLPNFVKGESGPHKPSVEERQTKPPPKYTEATLLRAMESCGKSLDDKELREALKKNGIGRPSTRASILEKLFRQEYIKREKKQISPTEKGIYLIDVIPDETLKSPVLTGEWENKLRRIEAGDFTVGLFMKELTRYVSSIVNEAKSSLNTEFKTPGMKGSQSKKPVKEGIAACPKCKVGAIVESKKAFGCSEWRNGCDFTIWKNVCKKKISATQVKNLLEKRKTRVLKGFVSKSGKKFNAMLVMDDEYKVKFQFE